jgi:MFS family permease
MLAVLTLIAAHNYVDRMAVGLLLQTIKLDLGLSDTQLGLLTGIAFALLYSTMGIPLARWADRRNRIVLIAAAAGIWSAAVALCGLARNFGQLMAARVMVGFGEAGCFPPAHSLIADYYDRRERPKAVSCYMLAAPIGMIIGFWGAGVLNEKFGWRMTFILLGLPGLALSLLAGLTLHDPRSSTELPARHQASDPTLREAWGELVRNASFRNCLIAFSISAFFGTGLLQWKPAFFMRSFGLTTREVGVWFAAIYGLCGLIGTYAGGWAATRFASRNEKRQLEAMVILYALYVFISIAIFLSTSEFVAFGFLALAMLGGASLAGPLFAVIHAVVPPHIRALAIASVFLVANLIGMGLGPLLVGFLSDTLGPAFGEESLRYALLAVCPGYFWAAFHVYRASKTVVGDIAAAQRSAEPRA